MLPALINNTIWDKLFTLKVIDNISDEVYVRRFSDIFNKEARLALEASLDDDNAD